MCYYYCSCYCWSYIDTALIEPKAINKPNLVYFPDYLPTIVLRLFYGKFAATNVRIMQNSSMRSTSRALSPYKLLPLLLLLLLFLFFLLATGERLVFLFEKLIHLLLFPWRNEKFSAGHVTGKREMLPKADVPQKAKQLFETHQTARATTKPSVSTTAATTTTTKRSNKNKWSHNESYLAWKFLPAGQV